MLRQLVTREDIDRAEAEIKEALNGTVRSDSCDHLAIAEAGFPHVPTIAPQLRDWLPSQDSEDIPIPEFLTRIRKDAHTVAPADASNLIGTYDEDYAPSSGIPGVYHLLWLIPAAALALDYFLPENFRDVAWLLAPAGVWTLLVVASFFVRNGRYIHAFRCLSVLQVALATFLAINMMSRGGIEVVSWKEVLSGLLAITLLIGTLFIEGDCRQSDSCDC